MIESDSRNDGISDENRKRRDLLLLWLDWLLQLPHNQEFLTQWEKTVKENKKKTHSTQTPADELP